MYVVCVRVCTHIVNCVHAYVEANRLTWDVFLNGSPLYLLRQDVSLDPELANSLDEVAGCPGIPFYLLRVESIDRGATIFLWVLRIQTPVLTPL